MSLQDLTARGASGHRRPALKPLTWTGRGRFWWSVAAVAFVLVAVTACGGSKKQVTPTQQNNQAMAVVTPTPGTPPPQTPTPAASDQTYIVKEGDTISTIAARFGVSEDDLEHLNHITDPNSIMAGQKLIIPAPKP